MRLITITDGSSSVAITLQVFFSSLLESGASKSFDTIALLIPHYSPQVQIDELVCMFSELKIQKFQIEFNNPFNRYYAKLMLQKYIDFDDSSSDDILCYLDYDHIFRKPINVISSLDVNAIYLSSELWSISTTLLDGNRNYFRDHQLPLIHFNTSLILSKTNVLRRAVKSWHEKYVQYVEIVSPRYLEEVAFAMSTIGQNIDIFPIPSTVQGNWQHTGEDWQMFHYGGETQLARKLKDDIPKILGEKISPASRDASLAFVRNIEELISKSITSV